MTADAPTASAPRAAVIAGGGEMGAAIRAHDWSRSSLGPIDRWPQSLRTVLRVLLTSRYAMWLAWGQDLIFFCNDAYRPTLGQKQDFIGRPASQVWAEIWSDIGPRIDRVLRTGDATWDDGLLLFLERSGYPEETYHTFSYSPAPDDQGGVGGMLCVVTEETERVLGERRLATLATLAAELAAADGEAALWPAIAQALGSNPKDLPFALLYLCDDDGRPGPVAQTGVIDADAFASASAAAWHACIPKDWSGDELVRIANLPALARAAGADVPSGTFWPAPAHEAVILRIASLGQAARPTQYSGFLVAGLNPFRALDDAYTNFLRLIAGQIAAGLAAARALEAERRRAEALAELDRGKTAFFSNVSHEFRTPLTLMLGPLEDALAGADHLTGAQRTRIEVAHRNALRLLKLVNTLLDYARAEAGRLRATFQPTDLAALTAEIADGFRGAMERAGLSLTVDCPPLPEPVYVDRDLWEKITLNLVSNAFKFTLSGGVSVMLRADGPRAVLTVRDTGTGIPADQLTRVFERFHRVDGQQGRSFEGSGIGLALSQELARLHGGSIEAASVLGAGSTFTLTLPFGAAHLPPDRVVGTRSDPASPAHVATFVEEALRWLPGGLAADLLPESASMPDTRAADPIPESERPLILLADDNVDMRDYVGRLLADRYRVCTVANGADALAAIRAERPDLLLTDVMMPVLDGFGLLRDLRADPDLRDLPVILLSARAGEDARAEGLDAGADDYLIKPFSTRELRARINANLTMARVRQESAETLRTRNEALEARVAARTRELVEANQRLVDEMAERGRAEESLRQSQKMEAVGQLTGGLAHDFNNLLTGIVGSLELLQRRAAQGRLDDVKRYVAAAQGAAERATALTHRLLAFSRRQALQPVALDARRLIAGMEDLIRRSIGPAIALRVEGAPDLWTTRCDPNQLENALLNLCINARDAMPDGGALTIAAGNVAPASCRDIDPGEYVGITVADTGAGMPPEVIARAFDPFFTTKPLGKGTGLGLSMIYGFVRQSGGHVHIDSTLGAGTTVRLFLPRDRRPAAAGKGPTTAAIEGAETLATEKAHEAVLVVDDDATVRLLLTDTLSEIGYRVIEAEDGASALRVLQATARETAGIDLLITDVGLPGGMNGRQLAEAARAASPALKVLFITGYAEHALTDLGALDDGMQVITKPFAMDALAARLRAMLDRR